MKNLDPASEEIRRLSYAMLMTVTAMCKHMLGDAKNYVELQLAEPDGAGLTVRIQRHEGKTPHQLRADAEAEAADLRIQLSKAKQGEAYWEKRARELGAEDR